MKSKWKDDSDEILNDQLFAEFKIKKSSPSNAIIEESKRLEESSTPAVKQTRPKSAFKVIRA